MSATIYLNGEFMPQDQAMISVMDRGFLFSDSIYEVIPVYRGHLFRGYEHIQRLEHSLAAIHLTLDYNWHKWHTIFQQIIEKNGSGDRLLYIHVTRGASPVRQHILPQKYTPTVFIATTPYIYPTPDDLAHGIKAITVDDTRWARCHIKSTMLLPNNLALTDATHQGVDDAIFIRDGFAMEGTSSNLFIVKNGGIFTPPLSPNILGGITRDLTIELAEQENIPFEKTDISKDQLADADEIWLTSSSKEIRPVLELDGKPVGQGKVGEIWKRLIQAYQVTKQNIADHQPKENILQFPCEFPIKVMGLSNNQFEIAVLSIVKKHFPKLAENALKTRSSKQGKYLALTVTVTANSKAQLDAVYHDLTDCELVVMAL